MDMQAAHPEQRIFHLTGRRQGDGLQAVDGLDLRPAALAPYRDLESLRHDFPLVLAPPGGREFVFTLSGLVDAMLRDVAPRGVEGERLRRHALQLERELRRGVMAGERGTLAAMWDAAAARLGSGRAADDLLEQVLTHAGGALHVDGELLGCDGSLPARLLRHAWEAARRERTQRFRTDAARLAQKLSDILRAADSHSQVGRTAQHLKAAIGAPHRPQFDFEALSRILGKGLPQDELAPRRRQRLQDALRELESQRFFATDGGDDESSTAIYGNVFDNCADAALAFRERLPALTALVKAMSIAELEVRGAYVEGDHDLAFDAFDEHALTADDLARFPDLLVLIPPGRNDAPENAGLMDLLSAGLPVKVLVQTSDLMEGAAIGAGHFAFGVRSARLATTAMGLGGMFVLQAAASHLYAMRRRLADGLATAGPALFCIYAAGPQTSRLPPYLAAAAAWQSRAFPAFCYDASAGGNWATRFSLANNAAPEADWPMLALDYADPQWQRQRLEIAFTAADFALCDARNAPHFALVPRERWGASMVPAAEWLTLDEAEAARQVPYLWAVDGDDRLQRVIVDARLLQETRRALLLWRRLQEHGGIHDSHAEALLARERAGFAALAPAPAEAALQVHAAAAAAPAVGGEPAAAAGHSRDEAWIETSRCPSCNECQQINPRMFAYDERKQAYIKDLAAGTYRQLVEAAESCQVAIIHPGKPRDPHEAGLDELLARAEPFR